MGFSCLRFLLTKKKKKTLMEEKESSASGVAVSSEEAPDSYRVAPRNENSAQFSGPTMTGPASAPPSTASASPVNAAPPTSTEVKKKRGRPRKYGPDGAVALALSPMPISSSIPLTGEFSAWKRGRGKPVDSIKKSHKYEAFETSPPGTSPPTKKKKRLHVSNVIYVIVVCVSNSAT